MRGGYKSLCSQLCDLVACKLSISFGLLLWGSWFAWGSLGSCLAWAPRLPWVEGAWDV